MKHRTWTTYDKTRWPDGPWQHEPDKEQWLDTATGLPCLIKRNGGGALCGYVGVSEGHPWFGVEYEHVGAEVHGGLTYSSFCQDGDEGHTICHVVEPGEPDRVWWLGFDCAHIGDRSPAYEYRGALFRGDTYKDRAYVQTECAALARQVAEATR